MDIPDPQASTSLTIPKTITFGKKGRVLHGQAREIVAHVINFMKSEAEHLKTNEQPEIPFQNFRERTRAATGISERMYKRVLKESKQLESDEISSLSAPIKRKISPETEEKSKQEESSFSPQRIRKIPLKVKQELVESEETEEVKQEFDEMPLEIKHEQIERDEGEYYPTEKVFLTVKTENTDFD